MNNKEQNNLESKDHEKNQDSFICWIKDNRKKLIFIGGSISTLIAIAFCIKNQDSLNRIWDNLKEEIARAHKYSPKWIKQASDVELKIERTKIENWSVGEDFDAACLRENLLLRLDREINKRSWGDTIPCGPGYHREHGYGLFKNE